MSTPTPSATKATSQNVSTPQSYAHLNPFSSPAPRSVPSPAATRGQAGKSPFNANSQLHAGASQASALNHSTVASTASGAGKFLESSPAGLPNFDSPGTMIPSLSGMGFTEGGVSMAPSMSRMSGLQASGATGGKLDDEERRKRLEAVVSLLRNASPRLTPEGLVTLAQRQGMESLLDPPTESKDFGQRDCTIAGETFAVDVKFSGKVVKSVEISLPGSSEETEKHLREGSKVLQRNLSIESRNSLLVHSLDKFSKNMEKLGKIDKLNTAANNPNFSCFEAITGVYGSLKKLYDHEKKLALDLINDSKSDREERAERETICKKSGRPLMNGHDKFGLTLDYWMNKRQVFAPKTQVTDEPSAQKLYSLSIECDSMTDGEHIPIRISNNWLSEEIEKPSEHPDDIFGPVIDWQEPPPTYLSSIGSTDADPMALNSTEVGKTPDIRFVARLDPPLVVPLQIAVNILAATGSQHDQQTYDGLYHSLVLENKDIDAMAMYNGNEEEVQNRKVIALPRKSGEEATYEEHLNCLQPKTLMLGKVLEEIPFSHPKQIVQILPILRQWALIGSLLKGSFMKGPIQTTKPLVQRSLDVNFDASQSRFAIYFSDAQNSKLLTNGSSTIHKLAKIIKNGDPKEPEPKKKSGHITFDILANADINIIGQDIIEDNVNEITATAKNSIKNEDVPMTEASSTSEKIQTLTRAFDITSDLDMFIAWIGSKY